MISIILLSHWQMLMVQAVPTGSFRLDMLRTVAQKILFRGKRSNNSLSNELRLIPDWNFTCSGTITSFLLGADIRSTQGAGARIRNAQYPEVQIWRRTNSSSPVREYAIEWVEEIGLDAGYFSPSGVLEYHLKIPLRSRLEIFLVSTNLTKVAV